jgi:hypothetical protein
MAIGQEGADRRRTLFDHLGGDSLVIQAQGIEVPSSKARVQEIDFKGQGTKNQDWALASLSVMARLNRVVSLEMLQSALRIRLRDRELASALELVARYQKGGL